MIELALCCIGILIIEMILPLLPFKKITVCFKPDSKRAWFFYEEFNSKISAGTPIILPPDYRYLQVIPKRVVNEVGKPIYFKCPNCGVKTAGHWLQNYPEKHGSYMCKKVEPITSARLESVNRLRVKFGYPELTVGDL